MCESELHLERPRADRVVVRRPVEEPPARRLQVLRPGTRGHRESHSLTMGPLGSDAIPRLTEAFKTASSDTPTEGMVTLCSKSCPKSSGSRYTPTTACSWET